MTKPRILVISELDVWSMGRGKGGPALSRTLRAYVEDGWDVTFITSNAGSDEERPPGMEVIRFSVPWVERLKAVRIVGFFARLLFWIYFQVRVFSIARRCARKAPFAVVYGYEITAVPVARWLSRLWRVPLVSRFQGTIFGVDCERRRLGRLRAWDHWLALRTPADLVIMTNDGTQGDRVLERLGVAMDRVRFWMNGTDREAYSVLPGKQEARRRLALRGGPTILTVSRLVGWKRVDRALRALPEVCRAIPDCQLVVVGDGEQRARLEALAADLAVAARVRFVGAVSRREVIEYSAAADLFLSLYDWSNLGNPLFEAMLAGKCVVTLDNGDTSTVVHDGANGILLKEDQLHTLPALLVRLLTDDDLRSRLEKQAKAYAFSRFWTWRDRMTAELEAVREIASQSCRITPWTAPGGTRAA